MWWLYKRIKEKTRHLENHTRCERCGQYFHNELGVCNLCSHLGDAELQAAVEKRRQFRMSLGKWMMFGALLIALLLVALARG